MYTYRQVCMCERSFTECCGAICPISASMPADMLPKWLAQSSQPKKADTYSRMACAVCGEW